MKNKILFIKCGSFSNINQSLVYYFGKSFPNVIIEELDVYDKIVPKHLKSWKNIFYLILEYGIDFIRFKKSRYAKWEWAFVTSYMFKMFRKEIQIHALKDNYIFTFQTQSLFDGSSPNIPHFVYTDSTVLAVLYYSNISLAAVMKSKQWMKLEFQIYQNASVNFTFSNNQSKSLIEQYHINPSKVKCVQAGSNIQTTSIPENKEYNHKEILFVGVNWERKGGPVLLKAFNKVLNKIPDAKLTIVGCSKELILINNTEEELKNCIITGKISLKEVEQYFLHASVFCMPTRLEPFGIVFIEAMLYKLPIISNNKGALPDMVKHGENGFLHDMDDVEGIANSLIKLLSDKKMCKKMGEAGHERVLLNYTWKNTMHKIKSEIIPYINN